MKKLVVAIIALMMSAPSAWAAVETYELENPHTQILFSIGHLGFSHSWGKFLDYDGSIRFDRDNPAQSSVAVTIQTGSIEMNDTAWNDHLKNADFFDVEKHPVMTFQSTGIEVTGEDTANITGDLTIKGVTKPVVLEAKLNKVGEHPMTKKAMAGFSATTRIKRSDFGMSHGVPMVDDAVDIIIEVEAIAPGGEAE